eukprot:Rhum_TRINITY_DN6331_c0_g2::Rhum_TRINITY_DN6331_c0_g2_i1::g.19618::m.19618
MGGGQQKRKRGAAKAPQSQAKVLLAVLKELTVGAKGEALLDNVFWVMSQFGVVERISHFVTKENDEQMLVQFQRHEDAAVAKTYLEQHTVETVGEDRQPWSCRFAIVFSHVPALTFKRANESNQNYDGVNAAIASGDIRPRYDFLWGLHTVGQGWLVPPQDAAHRGSIPKDAGQLPQGLMGSCVYVSGLPDPLDAETPAVTAQEMYRVSAQYGPVVAAKILAAASHKGKKAIVQFDSIEGADAMRAALDGVELYGQRIAARKSTQPNALNWNGAQSRHWMFSARDDVRPAQMAGGQHFPPSPCVLVQGWSPAVRDAVYALLEAQRVGCPREGGALGSAALLVFPSVEAAFRCLGLVNGASITVGGAQARVCACFAPRCDAKPVKPRSPIKTPSPATVPAVAPLAHATSGPAKEVSMEAFLTSINMQDHTQMLCDQGFDYATDLVGFSAQRLEEFGIKPGKVRRMLNALEAMSISQVSMKPALAAAQAQPSLVPPHHLQQQRAHTESLMGLLETREASWDVSQRADSSRSLPPMAQGQFAGMQALFPAEGFGGGGTLLSFMDEAPPLEGLEAEGAHVLDGIREESESVHLEDRDRRLLHELSSAGGRAQTLPFQGIGGAGGAGTFAFNAAEMGRSRTGVGS